MKKLVFGLCALLMCLMITSCGDNSTGKNEDKDKKGTEKVETPTSKFMSLAKNVEKNGNNWTDAEQWVEVMVEYANCMIEFSESNPTKEEYEDFRSAYKDLSYGFSKIDNSEAKKAMDKADEIFTEEHEDLDESLKKAEEELVKMSMMYENNDE